MSAVLAAAAMVAGACREKPTAADAGARASPPLIDAGARSGAVAGPRQPGVMRRLAPISLEEAQPLLPSPAGARVLRPVAKAQVGERVEGTWCFDQGELATLGSAVQQQLGTAGWQEVALRPNPNLPDRVTIVGARPPYALFGSLQRGASAECDGGKGQSVLSLGVHHVETVGPGGGRGTVGPGGTSDLQLR